MLCNRDLTDAKKNATREVYCNRNLIDAKKQNAMSVVCFYLLLP